MSRLMKKLIRERVVLAISATFPAQFGPGRVSIAPQNDASGVTAGSMMSQGWQNHPPLAEQGRTDPDGLCVQQAAGLGFNLFQNNLQRDCWPIGPMGPSPITVSAA